MTNRHADRRALHPRPHEHLGASAGFLGMRGSEIPASSAPSVGRRREIRDERDTPAWGTGAPMSLRRRSREPSGLPGLAGDLVFNFEPRLFGRSGEPSLDSRLHPGHERSVTELLPALL